MPDCGKHIVWPRPPHKLNALSDQLKQMHRLWYARIIINRLPEHLQQSLPQKLAACSILSRKRKEWGYSRFWKGDYLRQVIYFALIYFAAYFIIFFEII